MVGVRKELRIIHGVGINDADYPTEKRSYYRDSEGKRRSKAEWQCPVFQRWNNMLYRCYSEDARNKNSTYKGIVSVSDEWLIFSKFKEWVDLQPSIGMQLDKDILIPGNKEYSSQACSFVPRYINNLFTLRDNARGEWPLGVSKKRLSPRQINEPKMPFLTVMSYNSQTLQLPAQKTPEDAHKQWQRTKADIIDEMVIKWKFDSETNHSFRNDVAEALWKRSGQLRRDADLGIITVTL